MLRYKNYQLIKPNSSYHDQLSEYIDQNNGSIFHDVDLNKIVGETFGTELMYLVDNPQNINHATAVHITRNKYGLKLYNLQPLFDIPYAGFVGENVIDFNDFSIGLFESISYQGFPYHNDINVMSENIKIGETSMVDLTLSEDEIFSKVIHTKRRNMIRKALKEGISVQSLSTSEGLKEFWPILKQLHDKLGYDKLTFEYYNRMMQSYGHNNQAFVLIAYKNDQAISGVFVIGNRNYMHYYKGASLFGVKNEGQGELLQWEAIKLSKLVGSKYYDLCNLEKEKLPAIYRFKTGISNNIFQYPIYYNNATGYKIIRKLSKVK